MNPSAPVASSGIEQTSSAAARRRRIGRLGGAVAVALLVGGGLIWWFNGRADEGSTAGSPDGAAVKVAQHGSAAAGESESSPRVVTMSREQQRAVGLRTAKVASGTALDVLTAPGQVVPNESQYAFITPRAAGVVRTVNARIGQQVKAGDLLATIDSPVVGEARLELYTRQQTLEVAKAEADWEEMVYRNTQELLEHLRKGENPETIQRRLVDRAVGENRERLLTAYAQYRLAQATIERNRELHSQKLITSKQFQEVTAAYEVAQATYESLMDEMGYEAKLANTRARQAKHQAETAVRTAQERLRIFGVKADGTEPAIVGGNRVVGATDRAQPEAKSSQAASNSNPAAKAVTAQSASEADSNSDELPVSTYSIWAPFDGTILDREMIVPGVAVDTSHRLFTMANLASVWVEASVHEGDFNLLSRSGAGGKIQFRSPAYEDLVFDGEVIYTGDLVDDKSRTVKLLAKAENADRLLKPGMFVEVEIMNPRQETAALVPASAVLTEEGHSFVFVKTGEEQFVRREVDPEQPRGGMITIRRGLNEGEEIVVEGEFKLKALSIALASRDH